MYTIVLYIIYIEKILIWVLLLCIIC